jgi:valyl-tRNA synthetase
VLVTGFDILFFWVARMMMLGLHFMGRVPFRHVYIHALVRDEAGKKMSKSTGNVIDPLRMIEKYGTDSLRFTLTAFAAMGRDIKLSEKRIEGYRHFVNKIWNAARFALMHLPKLAPEGSLEEAARAALANAWILDRLEAVKAEVKSAVEDYRFNDMAQALYRFLWSELCDWFLEMAKPDLYGKDASRKAAAQKVLWTALSETLVLLHPVMPFVTQEIWSCLPGAPGPDIAGERYPEARPQLRNPSLGPRMGLFQGVVTAVRTIRAELGIEPTAKLDLLVRTAADADRELLAETAELIRFLARVDKVEAGPQVKGPKASGTAVVQGCEVFVPLSGVVDFASEIARLSKELAKIEKDVRTAGAKLANTGFVANAPAEVVEKEREKLTALADKQAKLQNLAARLQEALGA